MAHVTARRPAVRDGGDYCTHYLLQDIVYISCALRSLQLDCIEENYTLLFPS